MNYQIILNEEKTIKPVLECQLHIFFLHFRQWQIIITKVPTKVNNLHILNIILLKCVLNKYVRLLLTLKW